MPYKIKAKKVSLTGVLTFKLEFWLCSESYDFRGKDFDRATV